MKTKPLNSTLHPTLAHAMLVAYEHCNRMARGVGRSRESHNDYLAAVCVEASLGLMVRERAVELSDMARVTLPAGGAL